MCMCTDTSSTWLYILLLPLAMANLGFVSLFLNAVVQAKCISRSRSQERRREVSVEFLLSSAALPDSGVG